MAFDGFRPEKKSALREWFLYAEDGYGQVPADGKRGNLREGLYE